MTIIFLSLLIRVPCSRESSIINEKIISMGIKKIIAIASAKGGVGKSTICANLAYSFAKDHSVGILDADIYGPNQHLIFNIEKLKPDVVEVEGKKKFIPLSAGNIAINSMGFILDAAMAAMWRGPMLSGAIKQLMDSTEWGDLDYLFIDMPPGTGDAYITVAQDLKPDYAILVTTESPLAIKDTIKSKAVFTKLNIPILGYINNMSSSVCPHCSEPLEENPSLGGLDVKGAMDLPHLGYIPRTNDILNFRLEESTILFVSTYNALKNIL